VSMKFRPSIQPLERWIDQYQFSGRRRMSLEEREFLSRQLREAAMPSNCFVIGLTASVVVCLLGCSAIGVLDRNLFGPLLTISIVFVAITLLQRVEQLKIYRENLGDLQVGEVDIFRTASLPEASIVFLPRSGRILCRDGSFMHRRVYVQVNGLAIRRSGSTLPFPTQFTLNENHVTPVRCLSKSEKVELSALLPKKHNWKWFPPLSLWACTVVGLGYQIEVGTTFLNSIRVLLLLVSALCLTVYCGYRQARLNRVKNDLKKGTVICEQMGSYKFEHLANSDLLWTIDSHPASWRKRPGLSSWICPTI